MCKRVYVSKRKGTLYILQQTRLFKLDQEYLNTGGGKRMYLKYRNIIMLKN